jgi:hypothetical protein
MISAFWQKKKHQKGKNRVLMDPSLQEHENWQIDQMM